MQKPQFGMPLVIVLAAGLFLVGCKAPENSSDLVLTASDSALASILHDLHKADAVAFETSVDKGPQVVSAGCKRFCFIGALNDGRDFYRSN